MYRGFAIFDFLLIKQKKKLGSYYAHPPQPINAGVNRDAKELGKYLVRVANDEPEYRRLHQWRRTGGSDKFKALMDMQVDLTPPFVMRTMVAYDLCGSDIIGHSIENSSTDGL
jgi:hypothetical protein